MTTSFCILTVIFVEGTAQANDNSVNDEILKYVLREHIIIKKIDKLRH